jgi:hypothetical protein
VVDRSLYDDDILRWSEQQAEIVRRLGRTRRDLPNDFDAENVAEEIESVGRSELAAVESQIENILVHLIKMSVLAEAEAVRHWRGEVAGFAGEVERRFAPSMRQRIDLDRAWRVARERARGALPEGNAAIAALPDVGPFAVDDFLVWPLPVDALAAQLGGERPGRPADPAPSG